MYMNMYIYTYTCTCICTCVCISSKLVYRVLENQTATQDMY